MILSITNQQIETASVVAAKVGTIGRQIFTTLTSEKAQHIYKSIIIAVALTVAVIVIGLSKAAVYYWSKLVKPGSIVAINYTKAKARKVISQVQLSEWIELAKVQAVGIAAASIVGMSATIRGV
jgi:hypothetical protein